MSWRTWRDVNLRRFGGVREARRRTGAASRNPERSEGSQAVRPWRTRRDLNLRRFGGVREARSAEREPPAEILSVAKDLSLGAFRGRERERQRRREPAAEILSAAKDLRQ